MDEILTAAPASRNELDEDVAGPELRVVVLVGSPRPQGNSSAVAEMIQRQAEMWGEAHTTSVNVAVVTVATNSIAGCRGCGACSRTGRCAVGDLMEDVVRLIDEAHALVWVSPVYFGSVPSQLKSVIDRFQIFYERRRARQRFGLPSPYHARRPGLAVLLRGGGDPFGYDGALVPIRSASNLAEVTLADPIVVEGLHGVDDIGGQRFEGDRARIAQATAVLLESANRWMSRESA